MYTNTTSHAHYRCTIRKSNRSNWRLGGGQFPVNVMYVGKTCNNMSFKFIITRQNSSEYAISMHQIQLFFWGEAQPLLSSPYSIPSEPTARPVSYTSNHFFEFNTDRRTRGHQFKLKKRQSATDIRLHFFSQRVTNGCNSLPSDVVSAKSLNSFKAGLQRMRDTQIDFFMDE